MKNKRGQFQNLNTIAGGLVMFIILVAISGLILNNFQDSISSDSATVTNESFTLLNNTAVATNNQYITSVTYIKNASITLTETTDYTIQTAAGTITLVNNDHNNTLFNITYVFDYNTLAQNVTQTGQDATEDLGDWAITLISIGVGVIIITLIAGFGLMLRRR